MSRVIRIGVLVLCAWLCAAPVFAQEPKDLRIIRITPEGEDVSATRQIVIEFNRPVVPVGRMERTAEEAGVEIAPPVACQWRWLNTSALSCNLGEDTALQPATRYSLTINPAIAAEDGARIAVPYRHGFTTQRPAIGYTSFNEWRSPVHPVIRAVFSQPVTKNSVARHVFFQTGKEKSAAAVRVDVQVTPDENDQELPVFLELPGEKAALAVGEGKARKSDDQTTRAHGEEARRVWIIESAVELAADSTYSMIEEAGLVPAQGSEAGPGKEHPVVTFDTFPDLKFMGVRCYNREGRETLVAPGHVQTPEELCNPLQPVALGFSTPVLRSQVKDNAAFTPDLAGGQKDYNPWGDENRDYSQLDQPHQKDKIYYVSLPVGLKAAQNYELRLAARDGFSVLKSLMGKKNKPWLEDQFGRFFKKPVTMTFTTGHRNPNFELPHQEAVLEKGVDSEVPLYVNNLKSVTTSYRKVTPSGAAQNITKTQDVPAVEDVQFAMPLGVREMLDGGTGALYGTVSSDPAPMPAKYYPNLFATVTPYQVHLKMGHFQSVAWVTDLATGQPVAAAKVSVYVDTLTGLSIPEGFLAEAQTDMNGLALLPGADKLDPDLRYTQKAWREDDSRLFLRVDKDGEMALMPLSYDFSISTWQASDSGGVYEQNRNLHGHMRAWGLTAQGIYRAGDTMQYKIYVRDQDNKTLIPPAAGISYALEILDPAGKTVSKTEKISLSGFGGYAGTFAVPKTASVGWYQFRLTADFPVPGAEPGQTPEDRGDEGEDEEHPGHVILYPLRVLVSDFTPSPFRVSSEINGDHFRPGDTMDIAAAAKMHAGGPYADAAVRATITLKSRSFSSDHPAAHGFFFDTFSGGVGSAQLYQKTAELDGQGEWKDTFALPPQNIIYGVLEVESAVRDDRGKNVAALARADYAGVDRLVGLKSPQWIYEARKPVSIPAIVVDDEGNPVSGVPVAVSVEKQVVNTVKVKGAGNAYLSDTTLEWQPAASCDLVSGAESVPCVFTPETSGTYRITASIKDTKGADHRTQMEIWATGDDYVQWDDRSELALPIMPEKKEYKVGDTARYLVKNPYPGAQALVTIERYGVIDSFVKTLEGSAPVIEFPVTADYLPGFYLSVVVVSPRVEKPPGDGQVDLGKPAFRMGYVSVPVRDPYKEMDVAVSVENDVYRPRDMVKVALEAKPRFAPQTPQPVEMAVAVLDESVFDLLAEGRDAFDPYKGFYDLDPLDVRNYSLLTRLIGRQKFEKKGANPGGDGGSDLDMRNLFKYVSYWNPSIALDKDGKAQIEFEAPDNLTGWRVLALGATPGDRMGLGEGAFKVNRPTEVRPVMPNQVREGDRFEAGFSVMNRTDKERTLTVTIDAAGDLHDGKAQSHEETVTLAPYKRATVFLPLQAALLPVEREFPEGKITFKARATDETDSDGMEFTVPVNKMRVINTAATYSTTTENKTQEHIAFPDNIYTDTGDVSVVLSPSVIANLTEAFRYMRDYPYTCWEQILSRGAMAAHYKNLKTYLPESFSWPGSEKIPQETLDSAAGFQAPNGGMTYFTARDDYADPYLSAYTAIAFRWLRRDGYAIPAQVEEKLHGYLQNFLRQDAAPDFYQPGMKSTVRAVALAALADAGAITKDDLFRYRPYIKEMSLFGKAHIMQASSILGQAPDLAREAAGMILSAGSETGGKFMFNETHDDGYVRILATPLRDNCAVLSAFLSYEKDPEGKNLIGDKPFKMVRAITQSRGSRDHWENTQENVFCMNALAEYASIYESVKPAMSVDAALDGKTFGKASFKALSDKPVTLARPLAEGDPGRKANLDITRTGDGRLYYAARLRYSSQTAHDALVNAGMDIRREYSIKKDGKWRMLAGPMDIRRGDLVKVDLFLSIPTARHFVVVDDPVPGGLEPVNRDLATASTVDADEGLFDGAGGSWWFKYSDWYEYSVSRWSFYHQELRHDSARFYADWLPAGNYHLSYTAQAVAEGEFSIPPVKAEEMYDPDVYGLGTAARLSVSARE